MKTAYILPAVLMLFCFWPAAHFATAQTGDFSFGETAGGVWGFGQTGPAVVSVRAEFTASQAGRTGRLFVTAEIEPGWHVYSITQPPGGPGATKIKLDLPRGVRLASDFQPSVKPERKPEPIFNNLLVETHHGTITWQAPLRFDVGIEPSELRIAGTLTVQPCDAKSCLPPQELPFTARFVEAPPTTAVAPPPESTERMPFPTLVIHLFFAFLGGLILNVMPCVLPVISLKLLAFLQQAGESRTRVFILNVWYAVGVLSVFMALAALAAAAGLAWGEQFTLPWFKVAMTGLVFVMGLSFLGVWEIPIPGFVGGGQAGKLQIREGPSGAFFKGVFATILATPCSGPFLGPVFGYLLGKPSLLIYGTFAAVGLGMASPYLLIGAFPKLIRYLPKPGPWMVTFKELMGFLLLATVIYLFSTLTPAYSLPTKTLLLGLWIGCWWIGRTPPTASAETKATAWLGAIVVSAAIGWFAFTVLFWQPIIPWRPFSAEALRQARAEGKTVMVDFTADWCPNCKTNSRLAIERPAVLKLIKELDVVPLLADWTDHSPEIKRALNELGFNSIPLLAIWPGQPSQEEVILLPDLITERQVLEALKKAGPSLHR